MLIVVSVQAWARRLRARAFLHTYEELLGIVSTYSVQVFQPNQVESGVYEACARYIAFNSGDARQALDLLRLSGEIANKKNSPITPDCVDLATKQINSDELRTNINLLSTLEFFVLFVASYCAHPSNENRKERIFSVDIYNQYNEFTKKESKLPRVTDRRLLEVLRSLETLGFLNLFACSRGRHGRVLEIQLNYEPQTIFTACYEKKRKNV